MSNFSKTAYNQINNIQDDINIKMEQGMRTYSKQYSLLRAKINLIYASEDGNLNNIINANSTNIHGE